MATLKENLSLAASARLPHLAIIGGRQVEARGGARFDNIGPRDGRLLNTVAACDASDVGVAVESARRAFEDGRWSNLAAGDRKRILFQLADLMAENACELALLETLDTGKPIADAASGDIPAAIRTTRYYAEALDKIYGEVGPHNPTKLSYAVHEPLGVIGAIVPWNFPLHMAMWKVAPALAMGNSVVLKPAEQSPMTAIRVAELALEAGVPPGVFNVIPGIGKEAGDALARHMDVDMVAFTGSGRTARSLMHASAESNLKRISLELGGKSPQIVFPDCPDLDAAAEAAAWAVFYNQGQVCTAASRLLVHRDIKAAFLERVTAVARSIEAGDPLSPDTRFGAIVSETQMNTVLRYIQVGQEQGATCSLGGGRTRRDTGGFYIEPTIMDGVQPTHTIAREEIFGPVLSVIEFETEEDAFAIANDTVYGLAAACWTADVNRAHRATRALRAGLVWINAWDACDITMPFGGFKQSGFGRDRSLHAMLKYADLKAITFAIS